MPFDGILAAMKQKKAKLGEASESPSEQAMEKATGTEGTPEDNLEDAEQGEDLASESDGDDESGESGESSAGMAGMEGETEMDMAEQGDESAETGGIQAALAKLRGGTGMGGAETGGDPMSAVTDSTPARTAVETAAAEQGIALDEITGSDLLELLEMGGLGAELVMGEAEETGDGALGALLAKAPGKPAMGGAGMGAGKMPGYPKSGYKS